jgi:hypothetical protein
VIAKIGLVSNILIIIELHLVTQISTMYHCNISCNFRNYYQKYGQFLPIVSEYKFQNSEFSQI